jgi:type I restriction enzyme S subunit
VTCRGATCGTVNVVQGPCYITGNAMALDELHEDVIDLDFLAMVLKVRGLEDVISGSAQPQITREGLQNVWIPVPMLAEQKSISKIVVSVEEFADRSEEHVWGLRKLKQSLLTSLLSGEVRVPLDEVVA